MNPAYSFMCVYFSKPIDTPHYLILYTYSDYQCHNSKIKMYITALAVMVTSHSLLVLNCHVTHDVVLGLDFLYFVSLLPLSSSQLLGACQ
jgi:hypothetical protein